MNWEIVNGITGVVSAIAAILGIGYFKRHSTNTKSESASILTDSKLASFIIACAGWVLCCLSFLWIVRPYGNFPSDRDYQMFFGIILAFPAVVILVFGLRLLQSGKRKKGAESNKTSANND